MRPSVVMNEKDAASKICRKWWSLNRMLNALQLLLIQLSIYCGAIWKKFEVDTAAAAPPNTKQNLGSMLDFSGHMFAAFPRLQPLTFNTSVV